MKATIAAGVIIVASASTAGSIISAAPAGASTPTKSWCQAHAQKLNAKQKKACMKVLAAKKKAALPPNTGHVGQFITLNYPGGGIERITVTTITDPATGGDAITTPSSDDRFVGVTMKVDSTGTAAVKSYGDDLGMVIVGSDDQQYTPDYSATLAGCQPFAGGSWDIDPGDSLTGCVAFDVPTGVTPTAFHYCSDGSGV